MRFGRLLERAFYFATNSDGAGQEVDCAGLERARGRGTEKLASGRLEGFECDVHRLKLGFGCSDRWSERNKAKMLVKPKLARGPGNNRQVVTALDSMLPKQSENSLKYLGAAELAVNRQQTDF